ncbi:polyprotein [Yam asymptomatic virus 1]|uniref:Polyprotein n=1 Tax=Yam asymptomatic virus 1 TaxID=2771210 RepID=A0A7H1JMH2_9CLOS|nr:polyprotein [Yam asymptomatic virus 1]QNT12719.1 polyprotein [Yam asymptomatic virus 1]
MAQTFQKSDISSCLNLETMYSDLLKQVTSRLNFKENSDLFLHVDQSLKSLLKDKEDVLSHKPKCLISANLDNDSRALLDNAFPELQITYTGSTRSEHPMCYAVRMAFNSLFHCYGAIATCIDIGGNVQQHRRVGHTNIHVCNPTLSGKDVARRVSEYSDALKTLHVGSLTATINVAESDDSVTCCHRRFEDCDVESLSAYLVDVYDVSLLEIANGMDRHGTLFVNIALILPVELIQDSGEVEIRSLNTVVRWCGSEVTYFIGNSGDSYTHNRYSLLKYLDTNRVVSELGTTYDVIYEGDRLGYKYFRVVKSSADLEAPTSVRRYDSTLNGMYHCSLPMPGKFGYEVKELYLDGDFVERVQSYLTNVASGVNERTFEYTVTNLRSQKTCLIVGSRTVHARVDIDAADLPTLAAILLTDSVKKRQAAMGATKDFLNDKGSLVGLFSLVRRHMKDTFSKKMYNVKLGVLKYLDPKVHTVFMAMEKPLEKVETKVDVTLHQMFGGNSSDVVLSLNSRIDSVNSKVKEQELAVVLKTIIDNLKILAPDEMERLVQAGLEGTLTANLLAKKFLAHNLSAVLGGGNKERGVSNLETVEEMTAKLLERKEILNDRRRRERLPELYDQVVEPVVGTTPEKILRSAKDFFRWLTLSSDGLRSASYPVGENKCKVKALLYSKPGAADSVERNVDRWKNYAPNMGRKTRRSDTEEQGKLVDVEIETGTEHQEKQEEVLKPEPETETSHRQQEKQEEVSVSEPKVVEEEGECSKDNEYADFMMAFEEAELELLEEKIRQTRILSELSQIQVPKHWLKLKGKVVEEDNSGETSSVRCVENESSASTDDSEQRQFDELVPLPRSISVPKPPESSTETTVGHIIQYDDNLVSCGVMTGVLPVVDFNKCASVELLGRRCWYFSKYGLSFSDEGTVFPSNCWVQQFSQISASFGSFNAVLVERFNAGVITPFKSVGKECLHENSNILKINLNGDCSFTLETGVGRKTFNLRHMAVIVLKLRSTIHAKYSERVFGEGRISLTFFLQKYSASEIRSLNDVRTEVRNVETPEKPNESDVHFQIEEDEETPETSPSQQNEFVEEVGDDSNLNDNLISLNFSTPNKHQTVDESSDESSLVEVLRTVLEAGCEWVFAEEPIRAMSSKSVCPPNILPERLSNHSTLEYLLLLANSCYKMYERYQKLFGNRNLIKGKKQFPAAVNSMFKDLHIFNRHRKTVRIDGEDELICHAAYVFNLSTGDFISPGEISTSLDKDAIFCVDSELFKGIQLKIFRAIVRTGMMYNFEKRFDALKITLEDTPPGGGKTTSLLKKYKSDKDGTRLFTANAESSKDINIALNKDYHTTNKRYSRTIDSQIINCSRIVRVRVACVDECFLVHSGALKICCVLSGANEIFLYGDSQQIPFINRLQTFHCKVPVVDTSKFKVIRRNVSYRCPGDICALLSQKKDGRGVLCYPEGVKKGNSKRPDRSVSYACISSLSDVDIEKGDLLVTFTQDEKHAVNTEIMKRRVDAVAKTVHEIQGKTVEKLKIVRIKPAEDPVFTMSGHEIVALSRHTCGVKYYCISKRLFDGIGRDIRTALNFKESVFSGVSYQQCS